MFLALGIVLAVYIHIFKEDFKEVDVTKLIPVIVLIFEIFAVVTILSLIGIGG